MSEASSASGPDLRAGVALADVPDGGVLAGQVDGESVLLYREGERVTAVGATCTHYSGPLAEGVVEGGRVHCPWHHACFSLRTGEVVRAPALNPLPRWEVEVADGRVRVGGKLDTAPYHARQAAPAGGPGRIVVVGFGAAGAAAVEWLLREGWGGRIDVIDPDPDAPYDRPNLSKDYLAGSAPEEWIPLRPPGWYEERGVGVHRAAVTAVDTGNHKVVLDDGAELGYDALLLATGATPVQLPLRAAPGAESVPVPPVHYLRSLADSRSIIAAADGAAGASGGNGGNGAKGGKAVVIGASFIGLEVAASLRARGLEVAVVAPEGLPLERVMGQALGERIMSVHEQHGVQFHPRHTVAALVPGGVVLDDGSRLEADFVVAGVGVRPRLEVALAAGAATERGVLVDARMRTSVPAIWAAGDIARFPDARTGERIRVEHWVVAERQGICAARDIVGRGEDYTDAPFFWSQHYDLPINYVGHAERWDEVRVEGDVAGGDCAVGFRRDGRTLALATIFRDTESLEAEAALEHGTEPGKESHVGA